MNSRLGSVAIIGIGCRFPGGVTDPAGFWRLLSEGVDAITEIPADRIDLGHFFDPRPATPGRMMTRWGGFLDGIDEFDAYFFGISPREAERLDPQQRLLLETAWEALEDAGQDVRRLEGSATGVFVGQWLSDFEARLFTDPEAVDFQMTTGSGRYASSGRISYGLGLRGPSLTLDTACSSSLVAVHLAAQSIRSGESTMAIAGGVNVILQPHISVAYSQSRMMAPDGHCKFGDAGGDGYVRSEGAALIVLKALDRALADGDRIYAVVRGGAVNNDGRSSGSMGTPSRLGQEELLASAYRSAGVDPAGVGYVEAHGTGTRAGDPVELGALGAVLGPGRQEDSKLWVGSVKTNIGHTEGAAGVAGLIKAALALHHGAIPASLHCRELNPAIPWAELPLAIPRQPQGWARGDRPRLAGVSAFGIAGTNAHIVMEEAPVQTSADTAASRAVALLPLSAKSPEALQALAGRYADQLEREPVTPLHALCWNAATRRTALPHRAAFAAADVPAMIAALRAFGEAAPASTAVQDGAPARLVFVVPGQGAQWVGMARELLASEPVFRSALVECDAAARPYADWSIVEQLQLAPDAGGYRLNQIDVIQPVLVAIAIGYAALWRSLGIEPDAVVGHSMGEVGAACIAGVLDLGQAMQIICRRSSLMRRTSGQGAMALVELSMDEARARLLGREAEVSVAVSNSPRSSVISGNPDAVNAVMAQLEHDGVFCRLVKVDVASHSPQMEPLAAELQRELAALCPHPARIPIYSTVLGRRAEGPEFDASYWARNLRQPVMFTQTVGKLIDDGAAVFAELGPHPVLLPSIEQTAQARSATAVTVGCGRREEPEQATFLSALGSLWAAGASVDWARVMPQARRTLALPLYPWQRERHWVAAANMAAAGPARRRGAKRQERRHPLLGDGTELGGAPAGCLWELDLNLSRAPFLGEHRLHGAPVLAASAYVETALAAARELSGDGTQVVVESFAFDQALYLNADTPARVQLRALADSGALALTWLSEGDSGWTRHAGAHLGSVASVAASPPVAADTSRWPAACDGAELYGRLERSGAAFGTPLRAIKRAWFNGGEAFAEIEVEPTDRFEIAPAALDACFQLAVAAMGGDDLWMPASVQHIRSARGAGVPRAVQVRTRDAGRDRVRTVDVTLFGTHGPLLELSGIELRRLTGGVQQDPRQWLFGLDWVEAPRAAAESVAERAWLLIADRGGIAAALAARLKEAGAAVAIVSPDLAPDALALTPLLQQLVGRERRLAEVVYLRGTDLDTPTPEAAQAVFGLVRVVQELNQFDAAPRRCTLVTRGACAATADDAARIATAQAPLWGLAAAISEEHPALWGGRLDLDPAASVAAQAAWLHDELTAATGRSAAQRGGQRLAPRLARLDAAAASVNKPIALRPDATYLVTGGLGGVGVHVARWLIERGARRLAILGRSELAARSQWAQLQPGTREAAAAQAVREIEALGASVHYAAVDVGDEAALRRFLAGFEAEAWPPIRGVVHAAGVIDDRLVAELGEASLNTVLHGKLWGARHLDQLLPQLDLFVLFSSVAALLAQPGQASYAAANAFLDALAHQRRGRGRPALSVNWGVWQDVGFAGTQGGAQALARLSRLGIEAFAVPAGLAALGLLLERDVAQAAVLPMDTAGLRLALDAGSLTPAASALLAPLAARHEASAESAATSAGAESFVDQLRAEEPAQQRRLLEERLIRQASSILRLAAGRLDKRTPLGSYGLNSLMALELRNRIEGDLKLPLSATVLWNYPTVVALAEYLASRLAPAAVPVSAAASAPAASDAPGSASLEQAVEGIAALSDEAALAALAGGKRAGRSRR